MFTVNQSWLYSRRVISLSPRSVHANIHKILTVIWQNVDGLFHNSSANTYGILRHKGRHEETQQLTLIQSAVLPFDGDIINAVMLQLSAISLTSNLRTDISFYHTVLSCGWLILIKKI